MAIEVFAVAAVALLYASVGLGGGTGYLAVLALAGWPPAALKPTALLLNVLVGGVGTWTFWRAGHLRLRAAAPLLAGSLPGAILGGAARPDGRLYPAVVGILLLVAALRMGAAAARRRPAGAPAPPPAGRAGAGRGACGARVAAGLAIGVVAGLSGTGGGVLLAPTALWLGWSDERGTAGLTAPFVLANSAAAWLAAGAAWHAASGPAFAPLGLGALTGGLLGARLGARLLPPRAARAILALVLAVAAARMLQAAGFG